MNNPLNSVKARKRFYLRAILCVVLPSVLSEVMKLVIMSLNSAAYETPGATVARWAYLAIYSITVSAAYTSIAAAVYTKGAKGGAIMLGVYAVCRLAGESVEYFGEQSVVVADVMPAYGPIMSAVSHISDFFAATALAACVLIISSVFLKLYNSKDGKRKFAVRSCLNFVILFEFSVSFIRLLVNSGTDFFSAEIAPTVDALRLLVYKAVEAIAFFAIVAFVASRLVLFICTEREF